MNENINNTFTPVYQWKLGNGEHLEIYTERFKVICAKHRQVLVGNIDTLVNLDKLCLSSCAVYVYDSTCVQYAQALATL